MSKTYNVAVEASVRCMCVMRACVVHCECVRACVRFFRAIICTFMHGFKIIWHKCSPLGVKVPFETII